MSGACADAGVGGVYREGLLDNEEVYGIFGMHPHNAKYYNAAAEEKIMACLQHPKAGERLPTLSCDGGAPPLTRIYKPPQWRGGSADWTTRRTIHRQTCSGVCSPSK